MIWRWEFFRRKTRKQHCRPWVAPGPSVRTPPPSDGAFGLRSPDSAPGVGGCVQRSRPAWLWGAAKEPPAQPCFSCLVFMTVAGPGTRSESALSCPVHIPASEKELHLARPLFWPKSFRRSSRTPQFQLNEPPLWSHSHHATAHTHTHSHSRGLYLWRRGKSL